MSWKDRKFRYPFVKTADGDVLFHAAGEMSWRIDSYEDYKSLHDFWLWGSVWLSLPPVAAFLYFFHFRHDALAGTAVLVLLLVVEPFAFRQLLKWKVHSLRLKRVRYSVPFSERLRSNVDRTPMWKFRFAYFISLLFLVVSLAFLVASLFSGKPEMWRRFLQSVLIFLPSFLLARLALRMKKELRREAADTPPQQRQGGTQLSPSSSHAGRRGSG